MKYRMVHFLSQMKVSAEPFKHPAGILPEFVWSSYPVTLQGKK